MSAWTADELDRVGRAEELRLASYRHGPRIVGTVVGPQVVDVTLRLEPADG